MSEKPSEVINPWVRISERLPYSDQVVFVWDGKRIRIKQRSYYEEAEGWVWMDVERADWFDGHWKSDEQLVDDWDDQDSVTHWCPFPDPPNAVVNDAYRERFGE